MSREAGLVGRNEQRQLLRDAFSSAMAGDGGAVLISGSAGMGKTTLMRSLLDDVADQTLIGWGGCWHRDGSPGFWPWIQVFEELTRSMGVEAARGAAGTSATSLSALLPDLGPADDRIDDPDRRRVDLLVAAVRWLRNVAADRAVVVVLDDLHWADESSLDLLEQVLAAPIRTRLLLVGAYRPEDLGQDRRRRLGDLARRALHVPLTGLDAEEVAELAVAEAGEHLRSLAPELHARTGGHPLFVRELARLPDLGAAGQTPDAVVDAVTQRLDDVPHATRRALDVAAVAGNAVQVDIVGAVLDLEPLAVYEQLESAVERRFLRQDGAETWFAHDVFREALYAQLSAADRIRLHAAVGHALDARARRGAPVSDSEVARHLCEGLPVADPADAVAWARRAASTECRRSAFAEAAEHLARARRRTATLDVTIDPHQLDALLLEEVECLARSGAPDQARELLSQAATHVASPAHVADVALALQRLGSRFAIRRDDVIEELRHALVLIEGVDTVREARVTAALARELQHSVVEERDRAGPLSERALELARACGDDATLIECLLARHDAIWRPGTGRARADLGAEIAEVARRPRDVDRLADGLLLQANGLLETGDPGFRAVLDQWFGLMELRDEPHDRYLAQTRRTALALLDGRLDDAYRLMYDTAELGEAIHEPDTGNVLMSQRVAYAHAAGDRATLTDLARDAVVHWTGAPVHAHAVAAGALAASGDLEGAARELEAVDAHGGWQHENSYLRSVYLPYLATAAAALGRDALCRSMLDEVEHLGTACGVNGAVVAFAGPFAATAALLAEALGDHARAATHRAQSVRIATRLGAATWLRDDEATAPAGGRPTLSRSGRVWTVRWGDESASVIHSKGMGDLATLVQHPHVPIAALELASPGGRVDEGTVPMVDRQALADYRRRLAELDRELDDGHDANDLGSIERLEHEREILLAELRSVTGLGDRIRPAAGDQSERARKAVSARIRDTIRKLSEVVPRLGTHLDRSITTGLRCAYDPPSDEPTLAWSVDTTT